MSRSFYVSRFQRWPGVCEVDDRTPDVYRHHLQWPTRDETAHQFRGTTLAAELDPVDGRWETLVVDEDLFMDEGL